MRAERVLACGLSITLSGREELWSAGVSELRQQSAAAPIISTSGYVDILIGEGKAHTAYLNAAKEFGATCTLTKPFDPDGFLLMVQSCLAEARAARP